MGLLRKEAQTRADGGDDAHLVQADRSEQLRLVAVIDEAVGQPELEERSHDGARGERLGDGASRAALDRVLLYGDKEPVRSRDLRCEIRVHRLHEAHVDDGRIQFLARLERGLEQAAERKNGGAVFSAGTAPAHDPLAERQRMLGTQRR